MAITIDVPPDIEEHLRREWVDLDAVAKESALAELYRQGKLSHHQLAASLGLDRLTVNALLKRHKVTEDLVTADTMASQLAALHKLVNK